jgi:hypothetical protein
VFVISATGKETILHRFSGTDGAYPQASLLVAGSKLCGAASAGGAYDAAVIFQLTPCGEGEACNN